jgi:hypothetical protein
VCPRGGEVAAPELDVGAEHEERVRKIGGDGAERPRSRGPPCPIRRSRSGPR